MQILKLSSFPIEQVVDLHGLERRFGDWYVNRTHPTRAIVRSQRFDMRPRSPACVTICAHPRSLQAVSMRC
jgi:hypothetical protein